MFVEVYELHKVHDRLKLWEDPRDLVGNTQGTMLCMRDYNAILTAEDRPQGSPVQDIKVKNFSDFLLDAGMNELTIVDGSYTD
ncbi:hypothetical protein MTR67_032027 [Solanum verrucosum]|uniref:Uncharacterized protein n=1 Tax=Solanum verrucosum TaxID=315347 RepID=A0AAF0ZFZ9_SOLVR|nr:hypothetical protein MTR67_032027 [Solanum verrucosum]